MNYAFFSVTVALMLFWLGVRAACAEPLTLKCNFHVHYVETGNNFDTEKDVGEGSGIFRLDIANQRVQYLEGDGAPGTDIGPSQMALTVRPHEYDLTASATTGTAPDTWKYNFYIDRATGEFKGHRTLTHVLVNLEQTWEFRGGCAKAPSKNMF